MAERKPVDKLKFSELKDEAIYLNTLLKKEKDFKGYTIRQLQTDVRKWRAEADAEGKYNYNPEVQQLVVQQAPPAKEERGKSGRSTEALKVVAPVVKKKKEKGKKNKTRTVRPMGSSDTISADIILLHEEGKTVMEIYASDPVKFKYNTVYMIVKRYKLRAAKLAKQAEEEAKQSKGKK